jgi:hypothetical protein
LTRVAGERTVSELLLFLVSRAAQAKTGKASREGTLRKVADREARKRKPPSATFAGDAAGVIGKPMPRAYHNLFPSQSFNLKAGADITGAPPRSRAARDPRTRTSGPV